MVDPIFCQTVGLEIEVTHVNPNNVRMPSGWNVTGDASVESDYYHVNGIPFINETGLSSLRLSHNVQGGEILSSIIDTHSNYLPTLKSLCSNLVAKGEPDQSERAGLHVHLSFTNPSLDILKCIIKLGCPPCIGSPIKIPTLPCGSNAFTPLITTSVGFILSSNTESFSSFVSFPCSIVHHAIDSPGLLVSSLGVCPPSTIAISTHIPLGATTPHTQ